MKFRAQNTLSERQLADALAARGRVVTLTQLSTWRRNGLLPPLADHGQGPGRGKTYHWHEPDIFAQACAVFDLQQKYGKHDVVVRMLWLLGYPVAHPQLRRAWNHRASNRKFQCRAKKLPEFWLRRPADATLSLLDAALTIGETLHNDDSTEGLPIPEIIELVFARLARLNHVARGPAASGRLWHLIEILTRSLEMSDLLAVTSDDELDTAQAILRSAARLVQSCAGDLSGAFAVDDSQMWNIRLAERLGPTLFMLILLQVRAGAEQPLAAVFESLEPMNRRAFATPAHAAYQMI